MSSFAPVIDSAITVVTRAHPGHPEGIYAIPWYLLLGEPGSGRTAALHAMNLTWGRGEGPLSTSTPAQLCACWIPDEAIFLEPEAQVVGPSRQPELLKELCRDLRAARPREQIDGILLVLNVAMFVDLDERGLDAYAGAHRRYLIEIAQTLEADVPVYVVLTRYDTLWGFAEAFQWGPERTREEAWGFTLPQDLATAEARERIDQELIGLQARIESFCLGRVSSEVHPEQRVRAFQHLAEARALTEKLRAVFRALAMANAYERAPWIRALVLGSAASGIGDRVRASAGRFAAMGLAFAPSPLPGARPGGLPMHTFMKAVVLPERDIVPLRVRFWDDRVTVIAFALGVLLCVVAIVAALVFPLARG
jgi:type VI protein secretion system component VasK